MKLKTIFHHARARLTHAELNLYLGFCAFADSKTGECYPRISTVADTIGMRRDVASRTIKRLYSAGFLIRDGAEFRCLIGFDEPETVFSENSNSLRQVNKSLRQVNKSLPEVNKSLRQVNSLPEVNKSLRQVNFLETSTENTVGDKSITIGDKSTESLREVNSELATSQSHIKEGTNQLTNQLTNQEARETREDAPHAQTGETPGTIELEFSADLKTVQTIALSVLDEMQDAAAPDPTENPNFSFSTTGRGLDLPTPGGITPRDDAAACDAVEMLETGFNIRVGNFFAEQVKADVQDLALWSRLIAEKKAFGDEPDHIRQKIPRWFLAAYNEAKKKQDLEAKRSNANDPNLSRKAQDWKKESDEYTELFDRMRQEAAAIDAANERAASSSSAH